MCKLILFKANKIKKIFFNYLLVFILHLSFTISYYFYLLKLIFIGEFGSTYNFINYYNLFLHLYSFTQLSLSNKAFSRVTFKQCLSRSLNTIFVCLTHWGTIFGHIESLYAKKKYVCVSLIMNGYPSMDMFVPIMSRWKPT